MLDETSFDAQKTILLGSIEREGHFLKRRLNKNLIKLQ